MNESKKQLNLPRRDKEGNCYLSYSQMSMWKKSKRDYMRQYFYGEKDTKDFLKPYGDFGTKVGEALEFNDFKGFKPKEQKFLKTVPRLDEFEREITLNLNGFYMKGYIDTSTIPEGYVKRLADYKTGEIDKRTAEYEADSYNQTEIYSAALEQEFGRLPDEAQVIIIQRNGNAFKGEKLILGDKFHIVDKPITRERIDQVKAECQAIAEEISKFYTIYLKLIGDEQNN